MLPFSMIEALYKGTTIPWQHRIAKDAEHIAVDKGLEKEWARITEGILSSNKDKFEKVSELYLAKLNCERKEGYVHGYMAGVLTMLEVMAEKERNDKWAEEYWKSE